MQLELAFDPGTPDKKWLIVPTGNPDVDDLANFVVMAWIDEFNDMASRRFSARYDLWRARKALSEGNKNVAIAAFNRARRWRCVPPNAKSQATDADLSRQVACTDWLGVAVLPAPTFEKGDEQ